MFDKRSAAIVLDAMSSASHAENAACAGRLSAIGDLYGLRAPADDVERANWAIDGHCNVVAEISAELNVSRGRAAGQLHVAIGLRERHTEVARVFETGAIDLRMVKALINRCDNIEDPVVLATLDGALARWAPKWMKLSGPKLNERIDMWVEKYDPAGVREPRAGTENRYIDFGPIDKAGMASIYGSLPVVDAVAVDDRLDALASTVCRCDPRSKEQRRADALVAMAAGHSALTCECGQPECPSAAERRDPLAQVIIKVIAEQESLDGRADNPGYLAGFGPVPAALLRAIVGTARLEPVPLPPACPQDSAGYRPTTAYAEFVRCRDLTCRFPGCEVTAEVCDIDHTIPYPAGPTHPSNLKLLCRFHHLLKTFWSGTGGWADRQLPDGTVAWTAPSGKVYTTKPGGAVFFPALGVSTGEVAAAVHDTRTCADRGVMMPTRSRTRAQDHAHRVAGERARNRVRIFRDRTWEQRLRELTPCEPPPF